MTELIGRKIQKVFVNSDQSIMKFQTEQGAVVYQVYGDCCSESWFSDIFNFDALNGATVSNVEEIEMEDYNVDDGRCRQESDLAYGYKLHTEKGTSQIVFRNSSNGRYGGEILLITYPVEESLTQIVDDWEA